MSKKHKSILIVFSIILLLLLMFTCTLPAVSKHKSKSKKHSRSIKAGTISFSFGSKTNSSKALKNYFTKAGVTPKFILVSVRSSANGSLVLNKYRIELYNNNGEYISTNIMLDEGAYQLTEFVVIDETNSIIYVTPIEGSANTGLVNDPLPINFSVSSNNTTLINPEVISVTGSLSGYGYVSFTFNIKEENLIKNGDFSNGNTYWNLWMDANNGGAASKVLENGELIITITGQGNNPWDIGLNQSGFTIEKTGSYTLSFYVRSDTVQSITGLIQLGKYPWTSYSGSYTFDITSNMERYSFSFIMNEDTDYVSDLEFFIGGKGTGDIYFDNILLIKNKEIIDSTPCNPNAIDDAKAILRYIASLSSSNIKKAIVGQNCYHGNEITSSNSLDGYNKMVVDLYNQTGKWVSIIGIDYEFSKLFTPEELSAANQILIDYWDRGGLITLNFVPHNPWINDESDLINNPGTWDGPGCASDHTGVTTLKDIVDPTKLVYHVWRKKLDRIANALLELQDAGVVVLWRPMGEMNADFWWWGTSSHPNDPSDYIIVYQDMYNYFTNVKHLNNLLWVYSPNGSITKFNLKTVDWAYPGDQYVDVIADICYSDDLYIESYKKYVSMGKPFGMGEWGPEIFGSLAQTGTFDTTNFINKIRNDYPRISYWVCWHSYPNECWSIISNQNYNALMNDPDVITIDKLDWK